MKLMLKSTLCMVFTNFIPELVFVLHLEIVEFNDCILLVLTLLMCEVNKRGEEVLINSIFVYKVYFCLFENYSIIHIVHRTQNPQLPAKVKRGITQGIAKSIKTLCINFKWSAFLELKLLNLRNWYFFW